MMASSIFGAEQRISEPLSALAVLTGRHTEKNTRDLNFCQKSTSQRNQRVNDIAQMVYSDYSVAMWSSGFVLVFFTSHQLKIASLNYL